MSSRVTQELLAVTARLVADEGMEYGRAKRRALKALDLPRGTPLPANEQVEDAVREHLALYAADTHPAELRLLQEMALRWMQSLQAFRPHLSGAVWRGTATRQHGVWIDLFCDDGKAAEIELINRGIRFDVDQVRGLHRDAADVAVLIVHEPVSAWRLQVPVHLTVHDLDDLRGALKPDARGRSWRGDLAALRQLLGAERASPGRGDVAAAAANSAFGGFDGRS